MAFFCTAHRRDGLKAGEASLEHDLPPAQHVVAMGCGSKLVVATHAESSAGVSLAELSVPEDPSDIVCASVSPSSLEVAVCTDNKSLALWKRREEGEAGDACWTWQGKRLVPKRPVVLCFTNDGLSLVVGDKTGEAQRYSLEGPDWTTATGGHLLGHFSMLLDMVMSPSNSHVITCDRDEKIRVSKFPNSYNIESFCLAHMEFVSSICLCPQWPHLLISGSGDGTVKVWEWLAGQLVGSEQVTETYAAGGAVGAVTKVCCSAAESPMVVALLEKSPQLVALSLATDGSLSLWGHIQLATTPWDITYDWSDALWVCLRSKSRPVECYEWFKKGSGLELLPSNKKNPLLEVLNKWKYFEKLQDCTTKDWNQMRKNHPDNMNSYFTRKEERLKAKKTKPTTGTSSQDAADQTKLAVDSPPEDQRTVEATGSTSQKPPSKKTKLEASNPLTEPVL